MNLPGCRDFKAQFVLRPHGQAEEGSASSELVFRLLRDNRMVLVPTPFSAKLQREVDTFVHRCVGTAAASRPGLLLHAIPLSAWLLL